jgi:hypothetical protein
MNGQWIGTFTGTSSGTIHANIDETESNYVGVAYSFDNNIQLPPSVAYFETPNKNSEFSFRTYRIDAIDRQTANAVAWQTIAANYPQVAAFSTYAEVRGSFDHNNLTLTWTTDAGANGMCVLPRSKAMQPSEIVPIDKTWGAFKEYVNQLAFKRLLFRGQNERWRLRTPFHRLGRADLHRFVYNDIPTLRQHLSARTRHVFDLANDSEFGAFLNLVQHHGYPTPLLDWSYSPYVAAFFAYRGITNDAAAAAAPEARVRVFVFDATSWIKSFQPVVRLIHPQLHVTVRHFDAIENERMIPQQAASIVTSIDDIESYIRLRETEATKYLHAIDLPVCERRLVTRELSYMGITAGSLFPGFDGACEELAERNFDF